MVNFNSFCHSTAENGMMMLFIEKKQVHVYTIKKFANKIIG